jgi:SAM-dependent methyltransferase
MTRPVHFDEYAENYDAALNQGLSVTGEAKDYFARARIQWLARCLRQLAEHPKFVMDYGCGDGSSAQLLVEELNAELVVGTDTSERSLDLARRSYGGKKSEFVAIGDYEPREALDLAYCNGVFHHISPAERAQAVNYISRSLRPGGKFALWENNPWNPGTRYVMSRIAFDRDAITLSPPEAVALLGQNGFQVLRTDSLFFFPKLLKFLRWTEPLLSRMPLGGQYQVLCRKPQKESGSVEELDKERVSEV